MLSAAFPNIKFDVKGVCNFCRDEVGVRGDDTAIERGRVRVMELFAEQKARKRTYDAVLCNSGGKDSSYTLKLAVEKYGLTVLSFTLDNGFVAPVARDNINRVVDAWASTTSPSVPPSTSSSRSCARRHCYQSTASRA